MTKIVIGVDGSPQALAAVRWAAARAGLGDARLNLVAVVPTWANEMAEGDPHASVGRWAREDGDRSLAEARAAAEESRPGSSVSVERRGGEAWSGLTEAARDADLLVVGSHGSGGYLDQLLGSVATWAAAAADCPVVIVREPKDPTVTGIVLGIDLSDPVLADQDVAAFEFAATEASLRGVDLRVVAAERGWPGSAASRHRVLHDFTEQAGSALRRRLSALLADASVRHPGLDLAGEVVAGHPVDALVAASGKAELLVVGRRRRGSGLHLGSVANGAVHQARCSVAVIP
ncbi:universal stress protein [Microlunatus sp. GCM10028923]|uniref:universal stress protein n=1 Tax=Microlunatus sp. GCM10028923 TaxID=3273400 RepID=UPI00360D673C